MQSMKEPEGSIGSMVQALIFSLRKKIWDQALADVIGESSQDPSRLGKSPGRERQALETDHGVASPVGEPMVACDHSANLVTRGVRPGGVLNSARWSNNELIGGKHEIRGWSSLCSRNTG